MKRRFLVLASAITLFMAGCSKQPVQSDGAADRFEGMIQAADSLIDIKPDSSLVLCRQFFDGYTMTSDSLYARAKLIEGNAYFSMGDVEEAVKSMTEARSLARNCGDLYALVNATSDLGVIMRVSQKADSALILYNEALSLIPEGNYKDEKAHLLTSIAILYANTGHLDEAREYADKAVDAAGDCGDMDMIMYASSQAGAIYNLLGDRERGLYLTRLAVSDARRNNLPRYELKALGHLIDIHLRDGRNDSVLYYLKRGEELSRQFPANSVEGLGFLEEKYVVLAALGRFKESISVQRHLIGMQNEAAAFMPVDKLWLRMARNYDAMHRADSASVCYERAAELTDSLRGEETDRQLNEFYARFKTTEKELALANLERQKARADMWLAVWAAIALLAVILSVLYIRNRKKSERMRILQSRLDGIEQERGRLAQDLHDGVCNDLYGIELLLQSSLPKEQVLEDVGKIRADVRRISHELMPPSLQDVDMAQAIEDMVGKLQHAYPDKHISLNLNASARRFVPQYISYALYRICQELTGNILRHSNPTEVSLNISCNDERVDVEICNDGVPEGKAKGGGIGLDSVKERLASIGATSEGLPFSQKISISCPLRTQSRKTVTGKC